MLMRKLHFRVFFTEKKVFFPNMNGFETQNNTLSQEFQAGKVQIILGTENQQSSGDPKQDSILK